MWNAGIFVWNVKAIRTAFEKYLPEIDEIFKDNANGWNEFQKKYGGSIAQFSSPIFLRNYEIVIIKFSITSDYLAGLGYEAIFMRNGDNWEISACSWDN